MGGSRRRNVPDQMEQPMMRNEHIVRAHQAPVQAINPFTSDPWRVIHVDNTAGNSPAGKGTAASPYTTLTQTGTGATQAYDIVYVHQGNSLNSPYGGTFTFQAENQYLIGQGSSFVIPTASCGDLSFASVAGTSTSYPVLSNPSGASIELSSGGGNSINPTVDHISIVGSAVGITDGNGMPGSSTATVNDVVIQGSGAGQTGVVILDQASGGGTFNFTNMQLSGLTADGFVVDGQKTNGITARVNIESSSIENTSGSAVVVNDVVGSGRVRLSNSTIKGTTDAGVVVTGGKAIVEAVTISNVGTAGVAVAATPVITPADPLITSGTSTVQVVNSTIEATIGVQATSLNAGDVVNLTINQNSLVAANGGNGINLAVDAGTMNTNIVGNRVRVPETTAFTTGTAGGITDPAAVASAIYLTTVSPAIGLNNLTVKAVSQDNLTALNHNATVTTSPQLNPINTGTSIPLVPPPPPPNYNPAIIVPLPPP
jgi:hypothetical protein